MLSNSLTPQQAAALVGVGASTVRRWCDAGLLPFSKTTGGHRRIDSRVLVEFAKQQGLPILSSAPITTAGRGGRLPDVAELSERFYEQLLTGNEERVRNFILELVERTGEPSSVCDDVIAPAMHRIGEAWSNGSVPIFREHAATQLVQSALSSARSGLPASGDGTPLALCAALVDDPYSLGPSMCSLALQSVGYRTLLLGPQTPVDEILAAATQLSASLIAISVSVDPGSADALAHLCTEAASRGIRVVLGGQKLTPTLRRQLEPDFFGDTMTHLVMYAKRTLEAPYASSRVAPIPRR